MSGKQQGLRYFQKFLNSKASERNALAKKVLRYVMAVGFVLSPWLGGEAYAGTPNEPGIVRVDGTGLTDTQFLDGTSNVAHIYAEQADITNKVGFNRFQTFNVAAGETANLYFQKEAGGTILNSLVNSVESRISISGTVNAIRNNKIGGNLFFVSPNGMVVGSTGVINAGALTAVAPANLTYLQTLQQAVDGIKPEGSSISGWGALAENGSIVINGKINTATGIDLQAQTVTIENVNSTGSPETYLRTGVVFNDIVNTDFTNVQAYDISQTRLTLTKDEDGKIVITNPITSEAVTSDGAGRINIISRRFSGSDCYGSFTLTDSSIDAIGEFKMEVGAGTSIGSTSSIKANQISIFDNFGNFVNNGTITGSGVVNIAAGHLKYPNTASIINGGTIESTAGTMSLTSKYSVTHNGTIKAKDQIAFTVGGTLTNQGKIQSTSSNVQAHIGRNFKNLAVYDDETSEDRILTGGIIEAGGNVQVDYNLDTVHTGIVVATEAGTIDGISNSGLIWAKGDKDPVYDDEGNIKDSGSGNIWLTSSYNITNYGDMKANRQITLNARDFLHNYGLIEGVTYLDIKSIMGYVYNHNGATIKATGGNIDLSSGQANLVIDGDTNGTKKKLYRKFTPIIIEGLVEATSNLNNTSNETRQGNINITAYLGDIYVNGGTIEAKEGPSGEVKSVAGNVSLNAAQNITIGFQTESARADDPTTQAGPNGENKDKYERDDEREYYKPKVDDTSGKFDKGTAANISGTNITLTSGSEETNTVSMSEASSKIRLISDRGAKTISMSGVNNTLTASNAVAIYTDSMNIVGGTINAGALAASNNLNIEGGSITTNSITAGNELNVTGGNVSSNGSLELNGGGNVNIGFGASVKANNDIALTSSSAGVNASSITLGGSLQLQGNNIDVNNIQRSGDQTKPLNVKANGIGETDSAIENLTLNITGDASFDSLNVTNANVTTSGTLEIAELKVEEKAQLTSKAGGTPNSVDIYGKNATPEAGSGDVIRDTGDFVTIKIDDKGYEATVVGNNDNEDAVRLSTKLVDYDPYETYAEHYGDVADLFGRSDLIEASERPEGEAAKDDGKAVLKQDEKGLRIVKQRKHN